ncbi:MAG: SRPBCC family protein [Fimbriimonadales bacterium]
MPVIHVETFIDASPEVCFDLARNVHAHVSSAERSKEKVVSAPESGLLELGDEVVFEAVHFGVKQRLRSRVVEYDRPRRFVDEMQQGAFKMLRHVHDFEELGAGTKMVDQMTFESPFGLFGAAIDRLFLAGYLSRFLVARNSALKSMAEAPTSRRS